MTLRVVLAVWMNELGLAHRGPTYEHAHFLPALRSLGCDVSVFDLGMTRTDGPQHTSEMLDRAVAEHQADCVVAALYEDDLDPDALDRLSKRVVTFNWFADDHWRFESFSRRWAPHFSWVSTTDAESVERYAAAGCHNVLRTQWAAATEVFRPRGLPLEHEVTFVGQVYGDRRATMRRLHRAGVPLEVYGTGWAVRTHHKVLGRLGARRYVEAVRASTRLSLDEMVAMFERSRVNLNLADSSHGTRPQIKGRVFEVPACGGFLLTQPAEHLEAYLTPGVDIAVIDEHADLSEQVMWWLDHESQRAAVAKNGFERVLREHSYERRFADLFREMGLSLSPGGVSPDR